MRDLVNPVRVRICTHYAGEAIGTLLKIMQRDDISPAARIKAAKEVLLCIRGVLPVMEAQEFRNNIFQSVHERQSRRASRRADFTSRRAEKAARRRNVATADKDGLPKVSKPSDVLEDRDVRRNWNDINRLAS